MSKPVHHPGAIFVQLTTGCNAACVNCPHPFTYGTQGAHAKGNMSEETWQMLVKQIQDDDFRGQVGLYLHHEPLLVKSLYDKIKQINETTNAHVVFSTNGALLNEKAQDRLLESPPRRIHININSADPAQYEASMELKHAVTFKNAHSFIKRAKGIIDIQINCPVMPGVDTKRLVNEFPDVQVNVEYWANSRGGLLENVSAAGMGSRFKLAGACQQPTENLNVLWDGKVIVCCMDWGHESRNAFPPMMEQNIFTTYRGETMRGIQKEFESGCYGRFKMCNNCSKEMGFYRAGENTVADRIHGNPAMIGMA